MESENKKTKTIEEVFTEIKLLKEYGNYYIECLYMQSRPHYRIITDKNIAYQLIRHDGMMELSTIPWTKHSHKGWHKPDREFLGVEMRYLWRNLYTPLSFEEWRCKW